MEQIVEGKAKIEVERRKIVSKEMTVFYNPAMELNRTISVALLNCVDKKNMQIGSPLAGSGVREVRFLLELSSDKIDNISINDYSEDAVKSIKKNLSLNKLKQKKGKIDVFQEDANLFLLNSTGFDYIDIDPFGTPNPFLDAAAKRIARDGILAVTATDTAPLSGTYPDACMRKYYAKPLRNEIMHEVGLRILIRKCQLVAAQYDKALIPIYSYAREHYMRIFFRCEKGKQRADDIMSQHSMFMDAGPMWVGKLWDEKLAVKIFEYIRNSDYTKKNDVLKMADQIANESKINSIGFYSIPMLIKRNEFKAMPKQEKIIKRIIEKKYNAAVTHFEANSIRSDIPEKKMISLIRELIEEGERD